jgi:RNA polymerase sigma factor (TIGR02999 family)
MPRQYSVDWSPIPHRGRTGDRLSTRHGLEYEERIRGLLAAIRRGDRTAFDSLIEAISQEMRALSGYILASRPPSGTLQATALVNEAVLRLVTMLNKRAQSFPATKEHLMNLLSQMMRFTLTDHARKRKVVLESLDEPHRDKSGGATESTTADSLSGWSLQDLDLLLSVNEVLSTIERSDVAHGERRRLAIELHLFSGMNFREIAEELGVSEDTARRDCRLALSRLRGALAPSPPAADAALA